MLDLGFLEQVDEIVAACKGAPTMSDNSKQVSSNSQEAPSTLQIALFSATMPSQIEALAKSVMSESNIRIIVGTMYNHFLI